MPGQPRGWRTVDGLVGVGRHRNLAGDRECNSGHRHPRVRLRVVALLFLALLSLVTLHCRPASLPRSRLASRVWRSENKKRVTGGEGGGEIEGTKTTPSEPTTASNKTGNKREGGDGWKPEGCRTFLTTRPRVELSGLSSSSSARFSGGICSSFSNRLKSSSSCPRAKRETRKRERVSGVGCGCGCDQSPRPHQMRYIYIHIFAREG